MIIYFLRHGDASSHASYHESERPLTETGRKQADFAGLYMQQNGFLVNKIFTSPLLRARETGALVGPYVSSAPPETTEYLVNGANSVQLFRFLDVIDVESVLLVGHEPFLSETISILISAHPYAGIDIKKCTLGLVEIDSPIKAGSGILKMIVDAKIMQQSV
jgi:phosphohistidine phosphatase